MGRGVVENARGAHRMRRFYFGDDATMFIHTVYFWLKAGTPAAAREQLVRDCREYLGKIESVRHLWAGVPAGTPREVVDNSYGGGLTVVLDDVAGHEHYQVAPL